MAESGLTDNQIKEQIVQESITSYRGNCPCPYNLDRLGSQCGRRSAYSRPGGVSLIYYPENVTPLMIDNYKKMH